MVLYHPNISNIFNTSFMQHYSTMLMKKTRVINQPHPKIKHFPSFSACAEQPQPERRAASLRTALSDAKLAMLDVQGAVEWIGLGEDLQESPIFDRKIYGFRFRFLHQSIDW
jgi:hypothetical protein